MSDGGEVGGGSAGVTTPGAGEAGDLTADDPAQAILVEGDGGTPRSPEVAEHVGSIPTNPNLGSRVFDESQHRSETAKMIAILLVAILGASFLVHYGAVLFLHTWWLFTSSSKDATMGHLNGTFNSWLPVISSLASAAATYYFTRDKR